MMCPLILLWYLIGYSTNLAKGETATYARTYSDLSIIPPDIASDVTSLDLTGNIISDITWIQPLFALELLNLDHNLLASFPDLRNISGTLQDLSLAYNAIRWLNVTLLDAFTCLNILKLSGNRITFFPAATSLSLTQLYLDDNPLVRIPRLGSIADSLQWLSLDDCQVGHVADDDLTQFAQLGALKMANNHLETLPPIHLMKAPSLIAVFDDNNIRSVSTQSLSNRLASSLLVLRNNPLSRLPNFCHAPPSMTVIWTPNSKPAELICDCHAVWWTLLGINDVQAPPLCADPPSLAGLNPQTLSPDNLTCSGKLSKDFELTRIDPGRYRCDVPSVTEETRVASVTECAEMCALSRGCWVIHVRRDDTGLSCGITDLSEVLPPRGNVTDGRWYTLD